MIILLLGLCAGALTTFAWLPQLYRTWRRGRADDVSYGYLAVLLAGLTAWLVYGLISDQPAVVAANALSLVFVGGQTLMKWRAPLDDQADVQTPSSLPAGSVN